MEEEFDLISIIDKQPWLSDLKRRVQHYGYKYDYHTRRINRSMHIGPLPIFVRSIIEKLLMIGFFKEQPDQLIINEYKPGQGISPHIDCVPCFNSRIATVSLGSNCEMEFSRQNQLVKKILERRSALLLSNEARYNWLHAIRPRKTDRKVMRKRRISLTFRKVNLI